MDNDEIKALLRELKERSDADGEVKGRTVKISLGEEETPPGQKKSRTEKRTMAWWRNALKKSAEDTGGEDFAPEEDFDSDAADFRESDALLQAAEAAGATGRSPWKNLKLAVRDYFDDLKAKGIAGKELLMIGTGVLLLVLMIATVMSAVFSENKSVNVTSDEGLMVTVEQEPEAWCSQGTVVLGLRSSEKIQAITVNGASHQPEEGRRMKLTVEAASEKLEVAVTSESGVKKATVELPMLDAEKPSVSAKQENGLVTLTGVDSRSGLEGVYYGTAEGFSDVPMYQKYTGPFQYETGKLYYYYAKDNAGNRSVPVVTSMEPATGLELSETEVTLFPGESFRLKAQASPAKAYYNNLQIVNSDPSVVSLAEDGTVTALQDGDAVIEATADGGLAASCMVKVRSEVEVTVSALGDCTLGSDANFNTSTNFDAFQIVYGSTYFFENVRSILSEDDITFANFEGTLTTLNTRAEKEFAFKGDPSYTDILKDGSIDTVTLANNHSSDYGAQSEEDTKQYLTEAGIDYCTGDEIVVKDVKGVRVGLIGIYTLERGIEKADQVQQTIAAAKEQGAQIIVVAFHWGSEKSEIPDETQVSLAHTAIDSGADLVVGHHPHVLQGIELYQGKYIAYSLGNFCFGGNNTPSDMDSMIFQQTFSVTQDGTVTDSSIHIIPCSISSQSGWNNYQPTPAEGAEADRIMEKINQRSASFGQSYEAGV